MKLDKRILIPLFAGALFANGASAGVVATSYLEINNLFVEIDTDGDFVGDVAPVDLGSYITIAAGTREGNTNAVFNGVSAGNAVVDNTGVGTADAALKCVGPDCAGLGLVNNGQSYDGANLVNSHTSSYAVSDENVSGNAIGSGASGFTYADVGIASSNNIASASSQIFNNVLTVLTLNVVADINMRLIALYDAFVNAFISADITNDAAIKATASAEASFSIVVNRIGGPAGVIDSGLSFEDFAFDVAGIGDDPTPAFELNNAFFGTDWGFLTAGQYQVTIAQDSDVQASLIPEPGMLATFGIGLLGMAFYSRTRKQS